MSSGLSLLCAKFLICKLSVVSGRLSVVGCQLWVRCKDRPLTTDHGLLTTQPTFFLSHLSSSPSIPPNNTSSTLISNSTPGLPGSRFHIRRTGPVCFPQLCSGVRPMRSRRMSGRLANSLPSESVVDTDVSANTQRQRQTQQWQLLIDTSRLEKLEEMSNRGRHRICYQNHRLRRWLFVAA